MKNLCLIFTCLFLSFSTFAQKDETLFGKSGLRLTGIWGGPVMNFSYFDKDFTPVTGGYFGLEFNKNVFLGYGRYEMVDAANFKIDGLTNPNFRLSYQGGILGYAPLAHKIVHPQFRVLVGSGKARLVGESNDYLFVVQPSAGLEVNIFRWFRIGMEGGYRFISDSDIEGLSNEQLSGYFGEVKFKFGLSWGKKRRNKNKDKERHFHFEEEL